MPARRRNTVTGRSTAVRCTASLLLSGLLLAVPLDATSVAQAAPTQRPSPADPYADFITEAAQRFGVPETWIRAVMRVESRGDIRAISPKGAMGLMQIMPSTWTELRARYGLGSDPYDAHDNILAGAAYLRELHDRYGAPGFLAAYNAGPGRYDEYRTSGRPLPAETVAYVAALAPIIGGGDLVSPVTVAVVDPLAWTRSPLFVAQPESSARADSSQHDNAPSAPPPARSERDAAPGDTQTGGLFVMRAADAGPR
ncbi:lytic transglycosylase domain-containing protein [Bradyrhizobium sp. USDA 4520]